MVFGIGLLLAGVYLEHNSVLNLILSVSQGLEISHPLVCNMSARLPIVWILISSYQYTQKFNLQASTCLSFSDTGSSFSISYHKKSIRERWHAQWTSWAERFFCQSWQGLFIHHLQNLTIELDRSAKGKDASRLAKLYIFHLLYKSPERTWKQPRCPPADEWTRKLWYIYTMEYYSAIKKNSFESVLMRWMKLEPIIQSEVSQKDKDQYSILTHIYGI